jgi:cell wall-associated NlpC family hydrolase
MLGLIGGSFVAVDAMGSDPVAVASSTPLDVTTTPSTPDAAVVAANHAIALREATAERERREAQRASRAKARKAADAKALKAKRAALKKAAEERQAAAERKAARKRAEERKEAAAKRKAAERREARERAGSSTSERDTAGTSKRSSRSSSKRSSSSAAPSSASGVVAIAASRIGMRYVYGADGPTAFDCSGLTQWAFAKVGVSLPHSAAAQRNAVKRISSSEKRPGDLVFVHSGGGVSHVAIYAGNGYWIEAANPRSDVRKAKAWTSNVSYGRV